MTIEIIWNTSDDHILTRQAQALERVNGWPIHSAPSADYDWHHYMLYITAAQAKDFPPGRTSAYFTHYEVQREDKKRWWHEAAARVDLRLTAARQYLPMLQQYGPTALVNHPPIDKQFRPRKMRVGISGYVYKGGRKGEEMLARLAEDLPRDTFELVASGRGWPVKTVEYPWHNMAAFYQGLDVYIVTSITEGIPMGPLEALACGVPVVIPVGVGLLDDLPKRDGMIYRYPAGHYDSLFLALMQCWSDRRMQAQLNVYTEAHWARQHAAAIADAQVAVDASERLVETIFTAPSVDPVQTVTDAGIVYVAYGHQARTMAKQAMMSAKVHMPGYPVALVSDDPLGIEDVFIHHDDADLGARAIKTTLPGLVPTEWTYVLYLDADTELIADVSYLFQPLRDGWDMVICADPPGEATVIHQARKDNRFELAYTLAEGGVSDHQLVHNGGVMAFANNNTMREFFAKWFAEWDLYGKRDQLALLRTLQQVPVKRWFLGQHWNTIVRHVDVTLSAGVLHYVQSARRFDQGAYERWDVPTTAE